MSTPEDRERTASTEEQVQEPKDAQPANQLEDLEPESTEELESVKGGVGFRV